VISLTTSAARALMPVLVRYESFVASVVQLQKVTMARFISTTVYFSLLLVT
jgi:hypothetical protein